MNWNLACPDWEARLRAGRSLVPDLPLHAKTAARAVAAFNMLRLADVPGTPTMGEAGGDWFRDIVAALFGSLDPVSKVRMIRELFVLVPKKNSKTTNGALLMLTALLLNERPRAPFALMAPFQDVADEAFAAAAGAIGLDDVLSRKLHVRDHLKRIIHRESKAELEIVTFDPDMLTGKKFVGSLIDELHVISRSAKASKAIRQVRGGMIPFPEAFLAFITTMPEEAPTGVMKAELNKARAIRDGKQEGAMLPVLYEFPKAMQKDPSVWRDPANWTMVTPNAGRSLKIERLVEEFADASAKGEQEVRGWASQHLNIEIGLGLMSDSWAGAEHWESHEVDGAAVSNVIEGLTLEGLLDRCEVVDIGVDGGGLDDLLGVIVLGRERETGDWIAWAHAWAHPSVVKRRKDIAEFLEGFAADGDLTFVEQIGNDVDEVAEIASMVQERGLLDKVGADPHGIGAILDALIAAGIPRESIVGISQGWKLVGTIKTTERRLAAGKLKHGGTRLMAWCCGNAKVIAAGNAVLITKQISGSAKIDPLSALFDAVQLMALNPEGPGESVYEAMAREALAREALEKNAA